jgi:hypothetical protein
MVKFDLFFDCNVVGPPPQIRIRLDNQELALLTLPVLQCSFESKLGLGQHRLSIELCSKLPDNEVRENGKLVSDTWVQLKNMSIDSSMMNHILHDAGHVCIDWQYHPDVKNWFVQNHGAAPAVMPKAKYLNLKSTYTFEFSLPLREFMDRYHFIDPSYQKLYNAPLSRYSELKQKLVN